MQPCGKNSYDVSISWTFVRQYNRARAHDPVETVREPGYETEKQKDVKDEIHDGSQGQQGLGSGRSPRREDPVRDGKYNDEMVKAGVMLSGEGLHASSKGARVKFSGGKRTVTDGPFAETKELIAGFWLIQVKSREEAIEGQAVVSFSSLIGCLFVCSFWLF